MRFLAVVLCALALISFASDLWGPTTRAFTGAQIGSDNRVAAVEPGGPAARAGLRAGDLVRFDRMPLLQRIAVARPAPGEPITIAIERSGRLAAVTVVPQPLNIWNTYLVIAWAMALLYAATALLVAFRAPRGRHRGVILAVLFGLSMPWAADIVNAIPGYASKFAARALIDVGIVGFLVAAYLFVLWFPPRTTRASAWLWRLGLPVSAAAAVLYAFGNLNGILHVFPDTAIWGDVVTLLASAAMIGGVIDGVRAATPDLRKASIVAGSTLLMLALINAVLSSAELFNKNWPWLDSLNWLQWASGFGVSYAVLRHRLLDLNLVISRAAIFSVVSLLLLGAFALAEWVFATVLERALGPAFNESGKTTLAACVALLLGLSAGSVHRVVEHRLNRVFFARRYRALEDLHRFALETDAVLDSNALLELTFGAMRRNLDAQFVALYTGRPENGYMAVGTTAAADLPLRLDQNEEVVLRLRRWGEAFVVDNNAAHPLAHAYVAPMALRGTLYGFAICGPKVDRTAYLPDECEAVAALVHRVGIAFEWLTRGGATLDTLVTPEAST